VGRVRIGDREMQLGGCQKREGSDSTPRRTTKEEMAAPLTGMIDGGRPVGTADMKMKCDRAREAGEANQVALDLNLT
jgi:hypothetical protein